MTTSTPIEESNLALIGTEDDRSAKQAAAEMEVNWEGAGSKEGIEIWRIENHRADPNNANPAQFGINPWPTSQYGQFYSGDSYIVLQTAKEEGGEQFLYDIYFWIGKESSQDEYSVAAYKTVELDDLFGDAPVQHREVQHHESDSFLKCFENGTIQYLDGGIDSGFRHVEAGEPGTVSNEPKLYLVKKVNRVTRSIQIPIHGSDDTPGGLNHGDTFVLDCNDKVYTWFGDTCSPFEKHMAAQVAHNITSSRNGKASLAQIDDEGSQDEDAIAFWDVIGCKSEDVPQDTKYNSDNDGDSFPTQATKLSVLSDQDSFIKVEERPASTDNLVTDDVCLVDTGKTIFVWIGKGSSLNEQSQAMILAQKYITNHQRGKNTTIVRVLEGQEKRVDGFLSALS
mmetsp:Transcript_19201/g.27350  ORF Transcript_19201/g.27350 Transcript_19201/m.27350 type:complete len:396 (-) Transcript_19201:97-1284(-)